MKPWEKYAQNNGQKGPWNKYQDRSGTIANYADKLNPDQTQPEWLSNTDRAIAKNFAQSVPKQVEYLKKQYPDKEFSINANGQVLAKTHGDGKWQVLDPEMSSSNLVSTETLKDIGDMAYDIPSGIAQNAATTAAAITALPAGPLASLGAGAAASSASGAGLEALRQKLGQYLGIPQEVSADGVVNAGITGAVSPVLFGAGPTKGVIKRVGEKVLPKVGQFMSGISPEDMKAYANNYQTVDSLAKGEGGGILNYTQELSNKVNSSLDKTRERLGSSVSSAIDDAKLSVDISKAKESFQKRISFLESKPYITNAEQAEINSLKGAYEKYFGLSKEILPSDESILSNPELQKMYGHLDTISNSGTKVLSNSRPANLTSNMVNNVKSSPKLTYEPNHDSFLSNINKHVNNGIDESVSVLDSEAQNLAKAYNDKQLELAKANSQEQVNTILGQIKQLRDKLIDSGKITELPNEIDAKRAFDLQQKLKQASAFETNMTPETLSAKGSARGAYGAINESLDDATQGLSQEAKDAYANWKGIENDISPKFTDAQKTYQTISNLDGKGKALLRERLKNLADDGTLDIGNEADVIKAYNSFKDKAYQKSNTSLIGLLGGVGAVTGYRMGGGVGSMSGGALGAATGKLLGNQDIMSKLVKGTANLNKLSTPVSNLANTTIPITLMDLIKQRELEQQLKEQSY